MRKPWAPLKSAAEAVLKTAGQTVAPPVTPPRRRDPFSSDAARRAEINRLAESRRRLGRAPWIARRPGGWLR